MKSRRLAPADRDFFQKIQQAIFINPFTDEREAMDRQILGGAWKSDNVKREAMLAQRVAARLARQAMPVREYQQEDRRLLEYATLFSIYHLFCDKLDNLIARQLKAGDKPCQVDFAAECLGLIQEGGIEAGEAARYFSLFFQMRRAFFFINRIVGESPSMKQLRLSLWNNVFTHDIGLYEQYLWNRMEDFSTLILGETGTGKGMAAAAIGRSGYIPFQEKRGIFAESFTSAFVPLNLSQFPEQLLDSELFGHKKGAFTGAIDDHQGVFERCSPHGAIFLDEIGEVSEPIQIKLLKVLEERFYTPVGSHQIKRFQGRVIAATNRNIAEIRAEGAFRDDFYYRLCSDTIKVPPLRQRIKEEPQELSRLLQVTVGRITGKPSPELVAAVKETLGKTVAGDYPWPGNVRELEQAVRRILLTWEYREEARLAEAAPQGTLARELERGNLDAQSLLAAYCAMLYDRHGIYEEVARITRLDRRTVKKYIQEAGN